MIPAEKIKKIINNYELLEKDLASEKVSKKEIDYLES